VTAPDPPAVIPVSPEVTDHKQSAPILAQHSGPYVNLAEGRCHIARPVDPLLLDAGGVHDVVLKNLQPSDEGDLWCWGSTSHSHHESEHLIDPSVPYLIETS